MRIAFARVLIRVDASLLLLRGEVNILVLLLLGDEENFLVLVDRYSGVYDRSTTRRIDYC